jgi:ribosomal protein S18 acetylase RimI-like enzyme
MEIIKTQITAIPAVFKLYDFATAFQQKVGTNSWKGFEVSMVEQEIEENRHFVIQDEGQITATFVLTFNDAVIWKEADFEPSVYIHRIATHPDFRGRNYVQKIVDWTIDFAKAKKLKYVRLDTTSGNKRLNQYYIKCGFTYKGVSQIEWNTSLPEHYKDGSFALFEIII